jgi:UDP-N-acetylmuramate--alanine ligase
LERRFHVKGEAKNVIVLDDYGHHPTEITATLKTAKECWPERRLIVVFQPHRYTRTRDLFDRFVISFNEADTLVVVPIYAAGESPIEKISSEHLVQKIKEHGHRNVLFSKGGEDALSLLLSIVREWDLVVTLGAGNIYQMGKKLLDQLEQR